MLNALRKLAVAALATAAALSVVASGSPLAKRAADRLIGIVGDRTSVNDYDDDMRRAKAAGIDAFALNIGVDGYTDQQLGYAYDSAARNVIKVFLSFDFNLWKPGDASLGRPGLR